MVLPDGAGNPSHDRLISPQRLLLVVAALALVVGIMGVGSLTGPGSGALPLAEVPSPPPDDALDWERVLALPKALAYAITHLDDQLMVFTSTQQSRAPTLTGLHVWRSSDGLTWRQGDSVISPGSSVDSVTTTALGVVALGHVPDREPVRAWLSADGGFWLPLADGLPLDVDGLRLDRGQTPGATSEVPVDDIGSLIGGDATVVDVAVMGGRGIALVSRVPDRSRPYDITGYEIWSAPLQPTD